MKNVRNLWLLLTLASLFGCSKVEEKSKVKTEFLDVKNENGNVKIFINGRTEDFSEKIKNIYIERVKKDNPYLGDFSVNIVDASYGDVSGSKIIAVNFKTSFDEIFNRVQFFKYDSDISILDLVVDERNEFKGAINFAYKFKNDSFTISSYSPLKETNKPVDFSYDYYVGLEKDRINLISKNKENKEIINPSFQDLKVATDENKDYTRHFFVDAIAKKVFFVDKNSRIFALDGNFSEKLYNVEDNFSEVKTDFYGLANGYKIDEMTGKTTLISEYSMNYLVTFFNHYNKEFIDENFIYKNIKKSYSGDLLKDLDSSIKVKFNYEESEKSSKDLSNDELKKLFETNKVVYFKGNRTYLSNVNMIIVDDGSFAKPVVNSNWQVNKDEMIIPFQKDGKIIYYMILKLNNKFDDDRVNKPRYYLYEETNMKPNSYSEPKIEVNSEIAEFLMSDEIAKNLILTRVGNENVKIIFKEVMDFPIENETFKLVEILEENKGGKTAILSFAVSLEKRKIFQIDRITGKTLKIK